MLNQFPRHGKIASIIMLTAIFYFIYHEWSISPFNNSSNLKPGTSEYDYYRNGTVDTIAKDSIKIWYKKLKDSGRYLP